MWKILQAQKSNAEDWHSIVLRFRKFNDFLSDLSLGLEKPQIFGWLPKQETEPWLLASWLVSTLSHFSFYFPTKSNGPPSTPFRNYRQDFVYFAHSATTSFHQSLDSSPDPFLSSLVFP